jgi:hypothetical protein
MTRQQQERRPEDAEKQDLRRRIDRDIKKQKQPDHKGGKTEKDGDHTRKYQLG